MKRSPLQQYFDNKGKPAWQIYNEHLEEQRVRSRELDKKRRTKQEELRAKKQQEKEEKELIKSIEKEAEKAIYNALNKFFN